MTLLLGEYHLLASLGRGGMCDVLLAVKGVQGVDFTKLVVIKKLRQEYAQDVEFVRMFLDEARIAARLNHPNVIHTMDVGQEGDDFFLAMEYLDGQPLNRIVAPPNTIPLAMRLAVLSDVLTGMHYAHELRDFDGKPLHIVHRDVTPHNVFVTYDGQVKVVDFGIARAAGRATQTRHGIIKGKVNYMAPEQVTAGATVDRRVDIFTTGIMLYEAASGIRMWASAQSATILKALVRGEHPTSPKAINPSVPDELDQICRKALARDPADRYGTAEQFREDLDAYITEHEKRPSNRQIGAFIAKLFAAQRERAREILEKELASVMDQRRSVITLSAGDDADDEPEVEIDTASASVSGGTTYAESAGRTESIPRPAPSAAPTKAFMAPRGRVYTLWGVAAICLAIAGFGVWRLKHDASAHAMPVSPGESGMITLTLRATPPETSFQIDDGPPQTNPYVARLPADRKSHAIRAFAPRFADDLEHVAFDHDVSIRVALVRAPAGE